MIEILLTLRDNPVGNFVNKRIRVRSTSFLGLKARLSKVVMSYDVWTDHGGFVDIPIERWMRIPLIPSYAHKLVACLPDLGTPISLYLTTGSSRSSSISLYLSILIKALKLEQQGILRVLYLMSIKRVEGSSEKNIYYLLRIELIILELLI